MAQTFTLFINQTLPSGHLESGNIVVPSSSFVWAKLSLAFSQAQLDSPATKFTLGFWRLDPDAVWRLDAGFTFQGGPNEGDGGTITPNPQINWGIGALVGKTVKLVLDNTTALTGVGASVQFS